jgi:hypothetical protein
LVVKGVNDPENSVMKVSIAVLIADVSVNARASLAR